MNKTDPIDPGVKTHLAADEASKFLKSIANNHRLMILCRLHGGEKSVGQLAELIGLRDSTVSQHLALLRREGIIAGRRDGQTIWYRVESDIAQQVMAVICKHFQIPVVD